jgi:hypothetical protein
MLQKNCSQTYETAPVERDREVYVAFDQASAALIGLDHDIAVLMTRIDPLRNRGACVTGGNESRPGRLYGSDFGGQIGGLVDALEALRERVQDATNTLEV